MRGETEIILESSARVSTGSGESYQALVVGNEQADGMWHGWIEFHPLEGGLVRSTGRETTQPNRGALEYWATGLEPVYFDGAFDRSAPDEIT